MKTSLKQKIEKELSKLSKTDLRVGSKIMKRSIKESLLSLGFKECENFEYEGFNFGWYKNCMNIQGYNILILKLK